MEEPAGSETLLAKVAGTTTRTSRRNRLLANIALYVVAMALALAVSSVLIVAATDAAPFDVFHALYEGSLSRPSAIGLTLDRSMPLLMPAAGGIISTRADLSNIGLEVQPNEGRL